jgi:hypothetical protein
MRQGRAGMAVVLAGIACAVLAADRGFFNPPAEDQGPDDTAQQLAPTGHSHRRNTPDDPRYDCAELDTANAPPCSQR